MTTIPTTNVVIVCTVAAAPLVNATVDNIDAESTGDVMTTPLRVKGDAANTTVAYWASWKMNATTQANLVTAVRDAGWSPLPSASERTLITTGGTVAPWGSQRMWLFDVTWTPTAVLNALHLEPPVGEY